MPLIEDPEVVKVYLITHRDSWTDNLFIDKVFSNRESAIKFANTLTNPEISEMDVVQ